MTSVIIIRGLKNDFEKKKKYEELERESFLKQQLNEGSSVYIKMIRILVHWGCQRELVAVLIGMAYLNLAN